MKIRRTPTLLAALALAFTGATFAAPGPASCQSGSCAEAGCLCHDRGNWTCAGDCPNARCNRTWVASFR